MRPRPAVIALHSDRSQFLISGQNKGAGQAAEPPEPSRQQHESHTHLACTNPILPHRRQAWSHLGRSGRYAVMSADLRTRQIEDVIAGRWAYSCEQAGRFRSDVASMAMEGMVVTVEEMRAAAELAAGRIDFAEYRRRLGV